MLAHDERVQRLCCGQKGWTVAEEHIYSDDDISGAQRLDLLVGDGGDGNGNDHADWADAKLVCNQ